MRASCHTVSVSKCMSVKRFVSPCVLFLLKVMGRCAVDQFTFSKVLRTWTVIRYPVSNSMSIRRLDFSHTFVFVAGVAQVD